MKKFFSLIAAVLFAGSMMATTVTKTVAELAVEKSFTNSTVCTPFDLDEVISVSTTATDANTGKYYSNGEQIRLYQSGAASITLTAAEGYKISSITLTYVSYNTGILLEAESGVAVDFENVESATFTIGNSGTATNGQARITAFSVTYDADGEAPAVAKPVIAGAEKFYDEVEVSITCATDGAAIRYTLDGTDPTAASALYEEPFTLSESATVKAIAILGSDASAIAEKAFVKNPSFASFEALIAAGVEDKTLIEVSFEGIEITHFYESTYNNVTSRKGVYFDVNEVEYEIYNSFAVISDEWEVGGKLSGTLRGEWQHYVNTSKGIDIWEVVPKADGWSWDELTYEAPSATAIDNTNAAVKAVKVVRDGVLYIEKNGVLYNAQGAIVR